MPVPGRVPWLTHGHNVSAWHCLCLISMVLSDHPGWIWSLAQGLLCLLCSGTEGLLLLPEWYLFLWISLSLLLLNTWRIFWRITPEMLQQHQGAQCPKQKGQELAKHPCGCPEPRHAAHHRNPTASEQGEEGQRVPVALWWGVLRLGLKHLTWDF